MTLSANKGAAHSGRECMGRAVRGRGHCGDHDAQRGGDDIAALLAFLMVLGGGGNVCPRTLFTSSASATINEVSLNGSQTQTASEVVVRPIFYQFLQIRRITAVTAMRHRVWSRLRRLHRQPYCGIHRARKMCGIRLILWEWVLQSSPVLDYFKITFPAR